MTSHQAPGSVAGVLTEVWVVGRVMPQLVLRQVVRRGSGGQGWPGLELKKVKEKEEEE